MNDICKKCTEIKDKNCKGMEKFYSGCIYFKSVRIKKDITKNNK